MAAHGTAGWRGREGPPPHQCRSLACLFTTESRMGPGISGTERMQDSLCPGVGAERGMIIAFVLVLTASVGYERLWDWPLFGRDTGECLRSVLS